MLFAGREICIGENYARRFERPRAVAKTTVSPNTDRPSPASNVFISSNAHSFSPSAGEPIKQTTSRVKNDLFDILPDEKK